MKKFLVAVQMSSLDECFFGHEIIEAEDEEGALKKFHKKVKNIPYDSLKCIGEYDEETKTVTVPITFFID